MKTATWLKMNHPKINAARTAMNSDTIFEIGGQDSKYISLEAEGGESTETVVVDFTMNEACAAGTGSFLEERAEEPCIPVELYRLK